MTLLLEVLQKSVANLMSSQMILLTLFVLGKSAVGSWARLLEVGSSARSHSQLATSGAALSEDRSIRIRSPS
jgi:hypothetical protein